ncbi:MAG: hypothetical protein AAFU79_12605 [Myxococcota bacterium]
MVPDFEAFFAPLLRALTSAARSVEALAEDCADSLGLDAASRADTIAYDGRPTYVARTQMALQELSHAGLSRLDAEGYALTEAGGEAASAPPRDRAALEQYPSYRAYRERHLARRGA